MITLANGSLSLNDPNNTLDFGNLFLSNYQLTASSPATTVGTNVMSHSGLNTKSLNNMGWLVPENGSELQVGNLTGSGSITAVDGTVVIAGTAPASETIGLVDHSQLWLGDDWTYGFSATVDMDASSTIHFYDPKTFTDPISMLGGQAAAAAHIQGLLSDLAVVHSLTPGYAPVIQMQYAPGGGLDGMEIVDKPIPAPTPTPTPAPTPASTTSAIQTIVGSTVTDPTGPISATDHSSVIINTPTTPTSETISLDSTSGLDITAPVGMNFLAPINMTAGSSVYLVGGYNLNTASIADYPQLNVVDLFLGSTLTAQLHIHNESPGDSIWASYTLGGQGAITFTDSLNPPGGKAILIPTHVG